MQNRYAGDVGDFGKIALLRALAGCDLTLGVNWYLNPDEENNSDGKFVKYDRLRSIDPILFKFLTELAGCDNRGVTALQEGTLLPRRSLFYSQPLPRRQLGTLQRAEERKSWFACACETLRIADLVFCDPDNGIATSHITEGSAIASKYVLTAEIEAHLDAGQSVVVYQHQTRRKGGVAAEIQYWLAQFAHRCPSAFSTVFRAFSVRIYFVLPSEQHCHVLRERTRLFIADRWHPVFELGCPESEMIVS
jgi:hypothetical protein